MTSFLHYPLPPPNILTLRQLQNVIKWKFGGDLMHFIFYLTDALTMTNFFAIPPNF